MTGNLFFSIDLADPERSLPGLHGRYRRRTNVPPSPRNRQGRVHACDEG
jgi:hypothetical protein